MVSEMILSSKGLVANITGIRPLVCVRPLVDEKVVGLGEMPATELANKFLFSLGGKPPSGGFSVRRQLAQLRDRAPKPRCQLSKIRSFRWVLLSGSDGKVSKVKPRPVLVQCGYNVRKGTVFCRVEEVCCSCKR